MNSTSIAEWASAIVGVISAVATSAAAFYAAKNTKETRNLLETGRPHIVVLPMEISSEVSTNASIHIFNYGTGPAIVSGIRCFGVQEKNKKYKKVKSPVFIDYYGETILSTYDESKNNFVNCNVIEENSNMFFAKTNGVRFEVDYEDAIGNIYTSICEWKNGLWVRQIKNG